MADVQSSGGTKKKLEAKAVAPERSSKPSKVTMNGPSQLLLEIPADINTSLPVWEAVRSQKVGVSWTVNPYSISVYLTPDASKQKVSTGETASGVAQTPLHSSGTLPNTENPSTVQSSTGVPNELQAGSEVAEPLSFHTRSDKKVLICDDFLLGRCGAGVECMMHHTPFPFHWQLRSVGSRQWVSLPVHSQVFVERSYCDPDEENVCLEDGQYCDTIFFNLRDLDDQVEKSYGVRRLTNSRSTIKNPYFPSKWKIYWWNDKNFEEYKMDLSNLLLKKMGEKEPACSFHVGEQEYTVDFIRMMQTNISTGFQRKVCCRPVYRSPQSMQPYLKTGIQPDSGPPEANFNVNPLEEFSSWYPPVWRQTPEDYTLMDVPFGTQAYKTIRNLFHKSLSKTGMHIISIQQVQNLLHWDKYQRQKAHMQKQHTKSKEPLEKHLFHGTTKEASESICRNNFDPRVDEVNGKSHGYGTYFATTSNLSNTYTGVRGPDGVRHVFVAKVLVGRVCLGNQHYRRPPPYKSKTQQHVLYDACVDLKKDPEMFVVFDSCQCYPYYLIKYKKCSQKVGIYN